MALFSSLIEFPSASGLPEEIRQLSLRQLYGVAPASEEHLRRRLRDLLANQLMYPGRAPGATGPTGVAPSDERGWRAMLEEQKAIQDLAGLLKDQLPRPARYGGSAPATRAGATLYESLAERRAALPAEVPSPLLSQRSPSEAHAGQGLPPGVDPVDIWKANQLALAAARENLRKLQAEREATELKARLTDPYEAAKKAAEVSRFELRRTVKPEVAEGERPEPKFIGPMPGRRTGRYVEGGLVEGEQAKALLTDPNMRYMLARQRYEMMGEPTLAREVLIGERMQQAAEARAALQEAADQTRQRIAELTAASRERVAKLQNEGRLTAETLRQEQENLRSRLAGTLRFLDSMTRAAGVREPTGFLGFGEPTLPPEVAAAREAAERALQEFTATPRAPTGGAGREITAAELEALARRLGISVDEARRQAEVRGYVVR